LLAGGILVVISLFAGATEPELFDHYARFPVMFYGGLFLLLPVPLLLAGRLYRVHSLAYWVISVGLSAAVGLAILIVSAISSEG